MNLPAKFKPSWHAAMKVLLLASLLLTLLPAANADSVTVNSGISGTLLDSGFAGKDFLSPFTAADFAAARTGTTASILVPPNGAYIPALPHGPGAVWIGTNSSAGISVGDTALYAFSFNISGSVSSASLTLFYAVDNLLGESNPGIYINGTALPNSTGLVCSFCESSFDQENKYTDANIASLLVSGTNWLYIDAVNQGGPAGLIFSADIETSSSVVPEPSSLVLLGVGLLTLLALPAINKRRVQMPNLCG